MEAEVAAGLYLAPMAVLRAISATLSRYVIRLSSATEGRPMDRRIRSPLGAPDACRCMNDALLLLCCRDC
jgi:hypothetical protein